MDFCGRFAVLPVFLKNRRTFDTAKMLVLYKNEIITHKQLL